VGTFDPVKHVATKAATLELAPENHIPLIVGGKMLQLCDPMKDMCDAAINACLWVRILFPSLHVLI
jgi:hypothetical protein